MKTKQPAIEGLVYEVAKKEVEKSGLTIRPVSIDGESQCGTCDYNPLRINVDLKDGKIKKVLHFG